MNIVKSKYGELDFTDYPLVVYKMGSHNPTVNDVRDFLDKFTRSIKSRHGTFAVLIDSTNVTWVNAASRELLTIGIQHLIKELPDRFKANVIYADRFILEALLRFTIYFIPNVRKLYVYSDLRKARKKAIEMYRR